MWNELTLLFTEMGVATAICLALGLLCVIIEIFVPGFGFFGISGIILIIVGMVLRVSYDGGRGNPLTQLLLLLLITIIVIILAFLIMALASKKGWLNKTPIIMTTSAVPTGITGGTDDYTKLVGKVGLTVSMLRPAGIAMIEGERYDVVANGNFIDINKNIEVIKVEGVRIVVREIKED